MTVGPGAMRLACLLAFVALDLVCRRAGRHLTAGQMLEMGTRGEDALLAYNALAAYYVVARRMLYLFLPKHHALTHICYDYGINPRRTSCYQDEDMVGRMTRLYKACHGSSAPLRSLQRYMICIAVRWWVLLGELRMQ